MPESIVPYLLIDKYRCHYQGSVAKAIEDLGVEWDIIPGGCTGLTQPIDVGIGKLQEQNAIQVGGMDNESVGR